LPEIRSSSGVGSRRIAHSGIVASIGLAPRYFGITQAPVRTAR
jgi:hypothetical protein